MTEKSLSLLLAAVIALAGITIFVTLYHIVLHQIDQFQKRYEFLKLECGRLMRENQELRRRLALADAMDADANLHQQSHETVQEQWSLLRSRILSATEGELYLRNNHGKKQSI